MGMLLTYTEGYWPDGGEPKPRKRIRRRKAQEPTPAPVTEDSPYSGLSDDEVFDAYVRTLPEGEATERTAQVVELRAVAAFAHTFDADPDGGSSDE